MVWGEADTADSVWDSSTDNDEAEDDDIDEDDDEALEIGGAYFSSSD